MPSSRKKKKWRRAIIMTVATVVLLLFFLVLYQWLSYKPVSFVRYPEFGIVMPENYPIHGIDVSKYQSGIEWKEVKAMQVKNIKLSFSFIKATEGVKNKDPNFSRNWKETKQTGVHRGAYHFYIAKSDAADQAKNFIKTVSLEPGDLPPVLDVEHLYRQPLTKFREGIKKWLEIVESHYGIRPIIYTNADFYERYIGKEFDQYPLWVAHYFQPERPRVKREWLFWQHSDKGLVNGIRGHVDFNVFNGDSLAFNRLLLR